jgi:hypothetical protein
MSHIKDSADVQVVPGPEASWVQQRTQGIVASRSHTIVYPKSGGEFVAGNKIRMEIPSQDYWDMSQFTISFRTRLYAGSGNSTSRAATEPPTVFGHPSIAGLDPQNAVQSKWLTTRNGIQSLFNRVRILQGSMVIADIQNYNKLNRLLKVITLSPDRQKQIDFTNEGIYDPEDWEQKKKARNFFSSAVATDNPGHYFSVRLNTGFLEVDKYFPVKYTGQITFELYMEANENCLVSSVSGGNSTPASITEPVCYPIAMVEGTTAVVDYPNATYQVDDVQAHCHFVIPVSHYDEEMLSTIQEEGLTIMYNTWSEHTRQVTGIGRSVHSFQERATSVRGGLAVMENNVDLGDRKGDWHFASNNIERFQWKMGNLYVPAQPVECLNGPGRALGELEQFLGIGGESQVPYLLEGSRFLPNSKHEIATANTASSLVANAGTTLAQRKTWENKKELQWGQTLPNQFIMALNLEKSPGQLSGFNTSASNVDIELRLELLSQAALTDMPPPLCRTGLTWSANNVGHTFQPSKYKVHDTTNLKEGVWFSRQQPDNPRYNGEGDHSSIGGTALKDADTPASGSQMVTRFPDSKIDAAGAAGNLSDETAIGAGADGGGITSTCFTYTKTPSTYALLTFWANVDAQLNIMKVGQLEVLR